MGWIANEAVDGGEGDAFVKDKSNHPANNEPETPYYFQASGIVPVQAPWTQHDAVKGPEDTQRSYTNQFVTIADEKLNISGYWRTHFAGWRFGVFRSLFMMVIALLFNVVLTIVFAVRFDLDAGSATIYQGNCQVVRAADIIIHLALNISATLVLGASSFCMAGLCSPTRREVDKAHAKRQWLDIGSQSWRNLRSIAASNVVCWVLIGFASIPFHWVFNASFFSSRRTNQYSVTLVSEDFFSMSSQWRPDETNSSPSLFPQDDYFVPIKDNEPETDAYFRKNDTAVLEFLDLVLANDTGSGLEQLDPRTCINTYATGFVQTHNHVLVVTTTSNDSDPVLWSRYPMRHLVSNEPNPDPFAWICHDVQSQGEDGDWTKELDYCDAEAALQGTSNGLNWTIRDHEVSHCIAQSVPEVCKLSFNIYIMAMVLFCVLLGTGVMTYMAIALNVRREEDDALRTMGDAVASFLEREDPTTEGMCLVPKQQIEAGWKESYDPVLYHEKDRKVRWIHASSRKEWWSIFSITLAFAALLSACVVVAQDGTSRSHISDGLGFTARIGAITSITQDSQTSSTIVPTILVANIPQLVFSVVYLLYSGLFTRLLAAVEWRSYSVKRKPLRVSKHPRGYQKSTRMLGLPGKYAVSLMASAATTHWFISQSLFLVRIDGVNSHGDVDSDDLIARLGYSSLGTLLVVVIMIIALGIVIWMGWFRWLNDTMPGDGVNSAMISAACHLGDGGQSRSELGTVMWGDIDITDEYSDAGHCSFSAGPVFPPVEGRRY